MFLISTYIALALETGLSSRLGPQTLGGVSPSFVALLVVFLSLFATRAAALWACWLLGVLMDLSAPSSQAGAGAVFIIGPYALGYVFGCVLILQLRALVFRKRVLTFALLTFVCMLAISVVVVGVYVIRSWYPEDPQTIYFEGSALGELMHRVGMAAYTAVLAVPLGWLLVRSLPLWGFYSPHQHRTW
ncbi:MAG: hypothetical protein JSV91_07410 [Phycisphaerales bacterium]|nr:MAG: hypothetical protein JSV91_07410 [Phycisphaerales bacterium]